MIRSTFDSVFSFLILTFSLFGLLGLLAHHYFKHLNVLIHIQMQKAMTMRPPMEAPMIIPTKAVVPSSVVTFGFIALLVLLDLIFVPSVLLLLLLFGFLMGSGTIITGGGGGGGSYPLQ